MNKHFHWLIAVLFIGLLAACNSEERKNEKEPDHSETSELEIINKRISKDSTNPELYNLRAQYHINQTEINKALSDINKAIQLDDQNPDYLITLSDIYLAMGQADKCEEALLKAHQLDEENNDILLKLAEINFLVRDYKEAIGYLNTIIERDASLPMPYIIKGYAYLEGGDTARAIDNFRQAAGRDPENYEANFQLGLVHAARGEEIAEDYFKKALNTNPNSKETLYGLAMYYQNTYEIDKALEHYQRIVVLDSNFKNAYYNMGYINLVFKENFEEARKNFNKAVQADPKYVNAVYNRGYCNELLGDYNKARADYQKVLELHTNYQKAIDGLNRLDQIRLQE